MKHGMLLAALIAATAVHADERVGPPPQKWLAVGGTGFELCDIGADAQLLKAGQRNLTIACSVASTPLLRQSFDASPWWGKRIRFAGWVKTENIEPLTAGGAGFGSGLFLGTSGTQSAQVDSRLEGTTAWTYRELVLDVPQHTQWILIGISLAGRGQVWGRDFKFEEVSTDTPVTTLR